ncbi:MAG: HAMP domain-containing histidine kinase [Spirochaetia bacterium]|nr:HAMP domain-containing histidine kinase [Spirochaetia bacterium]
MKKNINYSISNTIKRGIDFFLTDIEYRFPITLAVIFLSVIVMTIWWQILFERMLLFYTEGRLDKIEIEMLKAKENSQLIKSLINENKVLLVEKCSINPCVSVKLNDKNSFLQINNHYYENIYITRDRKWKMIIWETTFLIFVLFLALSYLFWAIYHEKSKLKERQNFLAMATHELKRPLSSISLLLESLNRKTLPTKDKDKFINKGLEEIKSLTSQLENLLKIQELQSHYKKRFTLFNINTFVKEFIETWKIVDNKNKNRIIFKNSLKKEVKVKIEKSGFETILKNLLENALLYSKEKVIINLYNENNNVYVEIEDNGIGFTQEDKKNIGTMFYRSYRHSVQNIKGSGLGLFIVYSLAAQMGIKINLKTNGENQGSKFNVICQIAK